MRKLYFAMMTVFLFIFVIAAQCLAKCDGDFNFDGDVDDNDLAVFVADFGRTDCIASCQCPGDFDDAGDVDGSDLATIAADFGRTNCPSRIIDQTGGRLEFPNGVILEIPAGAVNEEIEIEVTDLTLNECDAILSARAFASHEKRCVGGFTAKPDGLEFIVPVTAIVPVLSLQPGGLPVQAHMFMGDQKYWLTSTNLVFSPDDETATMEIHNFSTNVVVEVVEGLSPGDPCREKKIHVEASHSEFSSADCQLLGADESITFLDCPGSPTEKVVISETSVGCPENMTIETAIQPPSPEIYLCASRDLKAMITGKDGDKVLFGPSEFLPDRWLSENTDIAYFPDPQKGEVHGKDRPEAVYIRALNPFRDTGDWLTVKHYEAILDISALSSANPDHPTIKVGEKIQLLSSMNGNFPLSEFDRSRVIWDGNGYVNVSDSGVVEGKLKGEATISAIYEYCGQYFSAQINVTVVEPDLVVEGKIGNCDWNAPYCNFGSVNVPVNLTVRVRRILPDGQLVPQEGAWVAVSLGTRYQSISPDSGDTDSLGEFHSQIQGVQHTYPYIISRISGYYGGAEEHAEVRAISNDICYNNPHGTNSYADYNINDGIKVTHSESMDVDYKFTSISVSTSATGYIPHGSCGYSISYICNNAYTEWWDTIQVIPYDLRYLGQSIKLIVDLGASVSVDLNKDGDPYFYEMMLTCGAAWTSDGGYFDWPVFACYDEDCCSRVDEWTEDRIEIDPGSAYIGSSIQINEQGYGNTCSRAGAYVSCQDNFGATSSTSSSATMTSQWLSISDVVIKPSGSSLGGFYIFSCSGTEYNISEPPW